MVRRAAPRSLPTPVMRPPVYATSPVYESLPVPSTIVPPLISTSCIRLRSCHLACVAARDRSPAARVSGPYISQNIRLAKRQATWTHNNEAAGEEHEGQ